jgi:hypothetical protein
MVIRFLQIFGILLVTALGFGVAAVVDIDVNVGDAGPLKPKGYDADDDENDALSFFSQFVLIFCSLRLIYFLLPSLSPYNF